MEEMYLKFIVLYFHSGQILLWELNPSTAYCTLQNEDFWFLQEMLCKNVFAIELKGMWRIPCIMPGNDLFSMALQFATQTGRIAVQMKMCVASFVRITLNVWSSTSTKTSIVQTIMQILNTIKLIPMYSFADIWWN